MAFCIFKGVIQIQYIYMRKYFAKDLFISCYLNRRYLTRQIEKRKLIVKNIADVFSTSFEKLLLLNIVQGSV